MKKAALGLTLALTMSTVLACAPGNQGAVDDVNRRDTTGYYQDGTQTGVRGLGTNRDGVLGGVGNRTGGGLFGTDNRDGGIFGGNQPGTVGNQMRDGVYGRGADTNIGMLGRDNVNNPPRRGGGMLFGGVGPRTQNIRGGMNQGAGFNGQFGFGTFDEELSRTLEQRITGMPEVNNCSVVVMDDAIVIGVDTNEGQNQGQRQARAQGNQNNLIQQIRQEVQGQARGKQIFISTDRGQDQLAEDTDQVRNRTATQK